MVINTIINTYNNCDSGKISWLCLYGMKIVNLVGKRTFLNISLNILRFEVKRKKKVCR